MGLHLGSEDKLYHYQLQFHKNPIKHSGKTHEYIFMVMNIAICYFHGLVETHEFSMKIISWLMKRFFMTMKSLHWTRAKFNGSLRTFSWP